MSRVVVTGRIPAAGVEMLRAAHEVDMWDSEEPIDRATLMEKAKGADALVTLLTDKVDAELLDAAGPQLKVVANVAVGYNNIDVAACAERGVVVTNTPGVLTDATADTAFGAMLMVMRRFGEAERLVRAGTPWQWGMFFMLGTGLAGKTIGLVGPGAIGIAMGRRAKAFGMNVVYSGRSEMKPEAAAELDCPRLSMDELLATSDVVSLHCPLIPEGRPDSTYHLIDAEALRKMKKSAFLVNSARGPVVDEAALVAALEAGEIAGAGLDVFEDEPTIHPGLMGRDDVVLLPHLGSATVETRTAMAELAARNTLAVLAGDTPPHPVTRG